MTKEQTIKHLKLMQSGARNAIRYSKNDKEISEEERKEDIEIYQDQLEALDMAIKALEREIGDDCEYNRGYRDGYDKGNLNGYELRKSEEKKSNDCISKSDVDQNIYDYAESDGLSYANLKNAILDVPHAIPTIPKGATNGGVIKAMLNPYKVCEYEYSVHVYMTEEDFWRSDYQMNCNARWWNAPYK